MFLHDGMYDTYIDIEFDLLSFDVWYFDVKSTTFWSPNQTSNSIRPLVFSVIIDVLYFDVQSTYFSTTKLTSNPIRRLVFSVIEYYNEKFLTN